MDKGARQAHRTAYGQPQRNTSQVPATLGNRAIVRLLGEQVDIDANEVTHGRGGYQPFRDTTVSVNRTLLLTVTLAACQTSAAPPPTCPQTPTVDAAMVPVQEVTPTPPAEQPSEPADALPYNCQAPLAAIAEISRVLTEASLRATRSAACVDGPGTRSRLDTVLACPAAPQGARRPFNVTYTVTTFTEGGRRACGSDCEPLPVTTTSHQLSMDFVPTSKGAFELELPAEVPGLSDMTAWDQAHDGNCYGELPPTLSREVTL